MLHLCVSQVQAITGMTRNRNWDWTPTANLLYVLFFYFEIFAFSHSQNLLIICLHSARSIFSGWLLY